MVDNRNFLFRSQSGGGSAYYQSGTAAAVTAFQQGGVNALLSFLASYSGGGMPPAQGGSDPTSGFEQG
jgi:hypothetical protein|tara:strand:+ start:641 stop:844 length:204 start_codon:yes stop_codon:yes gene_type:complete